MNLIEPKVTIVPTIDLSNASKIYQTMEFIARIPYKSQGKITEDSAPKFLQEKIIGPGHEAMIEFMDLVFIMTVNRGITHELVRHRIASFAQESTRYCNYSILSGDTVEGNCTFIRPYFFRTTDPIGDKAFDIWVNSCSNCEQDYDRLIALGYKAQYARGVLNFDAKASIAIKMNFRELRHFLGLRAAPPAHPQMKQVAIPLLRYLKSTLPLFFEKIPEAPILPEYDPSRPLELCEADLAKVIVVKDLNEIVI